MKFNLKNRPQPKDYPKCDTFHLGANEEWFEGFEKELRERYKEQPFGSSVCKMIYLDSLIKEILGE